jgi:hypothetical protein
MNLYLEEESLDIGTIIDFVNEYFTTEMKISPTDEQNHFYRYLHGMFMVACFREGRLLFNLFLISRADPADQ